MTFQSLHKAELIPYSMKKKIAPYWLKAGKLHSYEFQSLLLDWSVRIQHCWINSNSTWNDCTNEEVRKEKIDQPET